MKKGSIAKLLDIFSQVYLTRIDSWLFVGSLGVKEVK